MISVDELKDIIYLNLREIKYMLKKLTNYEFKDNDIIKFKGIDTTPDDEIIYIFKNLNSEDEYGILESLLLTPDEIIAYDIQDFLPDEFEVFSIIRHVDIEKEIHIYDFMLRNNETEKEYILESIISTRYLDYEEVFKDILRKCLKIINDSYKNKENEECHTS